MACKKIIVSDPLPCQDHRHGVADVRKHATIIRACSWFGKSTSGNDSSVITEPGNAHLNSEVGSISTADLLVLTSS